MTALAFGFRAYSREAVLTPDQREYVAHMLQLSAETAVAALADVSWRADAAIAREYLAADLREWRGIVAACERERNRCARLVSDRQRFTTESRIRGAVARARQT